MEPRPTLRLDKWLWQARFVKSRALAAKLVAGPGMRVNSVPVAKPAFAVGIGDVLTFALGARVVTVRIRALGTRRGPAPEARMLYDDLSPPPPPPDLSRPRPVAGGRPDKRDRRRIAATLRDPLD
ncbi:MAG: RNA-binding S4 domain-containing protein [Rhodobacteraceae bacterium]|nr:MAG: RNA-binding S4 domain-containing protein [Paracoccaceae bacterium]